MKNFRNRRKIFEAVIPECLNRESRAFRQKVDKLDSRFRGNDGYIFRSLFFLGVIIICSATVEARPLLTEEVPTIGAQHFETGFSVSSRSDKFSQSGTSIDTVLFPFFVRFGLTDALDFTAYFQHASQTLTTNGVHLTGSSNAEYSTGLKYSPSPIYGIQALWHLQKSERPEDDLPIARGNDFELKALLKAPTAFPINLNIGYDLRGKYRSQMGVTTDPSHLMEPGNIFETGGSIEVPLAYHMSLLSELAYYKVDRSKRDHESIDNSSGEAMDALGGLCWTYGGWIIQGGISFGLLQENFTSFDTERGSGDITYRFALSYHLKPSKPSL